MVLIKHLTKYFALFSEKFHSKKMSSNFLPINWHIVVIKHLTKYFALFLVSPN